MRACIHIFVCFVLYYLLPNEELYFIVQISRSDIILEAAGHGVAEPGADNV